MSDTKPTHSHSGDEPKPQGAFKTVEYDEETGGASVKVTPASKAAVAMAAGEPVKGGATAAGDEDLNDLTVTDLHERAKAAGVSGYSTMHKDELVKAVRKAEKNQ